MPLLAFGETVEERTVFSGGPSGGGRPSGLFDDMSKVGFGRADHIQVDLGVTAVEAPQHPPCSSRRGGWKSCHDCRVADLWGGQQFTGACSGRVELYASQEHHS